MKARFVIIDPKERNDFEKQWQLPYGYSNCEIFMDRDKAIDWFNKSLGKLDRKKYVIEMCDAGKRQIVYREDD